jgi:hypothetical protein
MPAKKAELLPTPESIAAYVAKNASARAMAPMHGPMETVREDDYKGRHITVRTTYEIEVDGQPVTGHVNVSNGGEVAYHGLPNMKFDSAIQLVRKLIDQFPEDFQAAARQPRRTNRQRMSGMGGMTSRRAMLTKAKKKSRNKRDHR